MNSLKFSQCYTTNDLFPKVVDPKTGEEKQIIVCVDDGIRPNTTLMDLAKLKPAFRKDGSTTAGAQEICS